ncbi:MAG: acetate/propionate family kinase [Trueperaceae bacterium]
MLEQLLTLVINAGSSSLKVKLLPTHYSFVAERIGGASTIKASFPTPVAKLLRTHEEALQFCLEAFVPELQREHELRLEDVRLVAHRVVHGGERYKESVVIDEAVLRDIEKLSVLAPLHNPANLEAIRAARNALPYASHVAVFDTAFHATLPTKAFLYGLPRALYTQGIRKYGFHGTSHDYVTREAAKVLATSREELKIVSLHLGNGASAAAVKHGQSVDTTMGLTPLDGLLMGTRTGELDPGVLLHLLRQGSSPAELDALLNKQSGLLGVSEISNDMRDLRSAACEGNVHAREALEIFCYRITKVIGAYAAAMSGLDAVVFTGGIGEHDATTRAAALQGLEFLGLELDVTKNQRHETIISTDSSYVKLLIIPTDEEGMMASLAATLLRTTKDTINERTVTRKY